MFRKHLSDICNLLTLIVASVYLLLVRNADVLYMAQDHSLCLNEPSVFFHDVAHLPGGLLVWIGCWLTQLFYYPWLGATVLLLIWVATYFMLTRAFRIPSQWRWVALIPLMALLVSEVDLGYWIYYIKQPGYWFRESLGLLTVSLLLWLQSAARTADLCHRIIRWAAPCLAILTYPLIGWYATLALVAMGIRYLLSRQWGAGSFSLLLALLMPPLMVKCYTSVRDADAWTIGFPLIESNLSLSWLLTVPFIVMVAALLLMISVKVWPEIKKASLYIQATVLAGMLLTSVSCSFDDYNYHAEIEMYRDMEEFRWDRLISRMDKLPEGPTRQMVVCKNLALINLKHLGDGLFLYPNIGPDPKVNPGLEMHIAQTSAPMFYLQHGLANDAIHWCIENSVEYGLSMNDIKIMTLAAILNGENQLAAKYINMLRHTLFGSIWAKRYYPLTVQPDWIKDYPELQTMKKLHDSDIEYIVGDLGDCEFRIYRHFSNTLYNPDPLFQEVALAYSLMLKNREISMIQLQTYRELHRRQKELPHYYQEAYDLFRKMEQHTLTKEEVDKMIPAVHGKTYPWFFFKVNDAKTY